MKETAEYLNDSAVLFASEGSHWEAIACLKKGLLLEPENGILWFNLALSYRAIGRRSESRTALMNAVEANPADPDIIDTLAVVLHELGEDSAAEDAYLKALDLAPGNGRIWNNFGVLQFSQTKYTDAASSFEKALSLIPDFEDALYNLRDTYDELGKTEQRDTCTRLMAEMHRTNGE